jgi:hypothetical protein
VLESAVTKTELFRSRIAPVLFGLVIALMARKSCHEQAQEHATFVLDLGEARAQVRSIDAELWMNGALVTDWHRHALDGQAIGAARFESLVPVADGELRVDVGLPAASKHIVRHVHASDGSTVTVPLGDDLK